MKLFTSLILICLSFTALSQQPSTVPYEKGLHYTEINPPYPTKNSEKVVVYEFFGYMCPHCASFQPFMKSWNNTLSIQCYQLKLSNEHQGFAFERNPDVAVTLLQHHSGGKVSAALQMATAVGKL